MRSFLIVFCLTLCMLTTLPLSAQKNGPWEMEDSHATAGLRGIHNAGSGVAWASGTGGTILRTEDGGYLWQTCGAPADGEKLDFRGVWAWDAQTTVVMSSGPGGLSQVYKTTDGCATWKLLYTNPDEKGFWDAIAFWDQDNGVILGDPVDGVLTVLRIFSLGVDLSRTLHPARFDASNFAAFAASNSALALGEKSGTGPRLWIGIGGKGGAKVLALATVGPASIGAGAAPQYRLNQWTNSAVPLVSGTDSSGVFSLGFKDQQIGIAVGGDYQKPNETAGTAAWTSDGGKTWTASTKPPHGYRSAVAWDAADKAWITVGTNGSDVSYDDGKTWQPLDDGSWNALSLPWVVGPKGRIAKLVSLKHAELAPEAAKSKATAAP